MKPIDKKLFPFEGRYLLRDGLRYHYLDEGDGSPVLMVHGNPTWSFYYRNLVRTLRTNHRVIVPDHIGCGLSDKPSDDRYDYTLENRVADLEALVDHLQLKEPITLVLHDWGGMIGMTFAHRHPEKIGRIVLFNTAAFHLPKSKAFPAALGVVRNTGVGAFLVRRFNAFSRAAAWVGCKRNPLSPELRDAYCAPYDNWEDRIATLRFVQDIPLSPKDRAYGIVSEVQENLSQFDGIPKLICWGEKDFVFDTHFLKQWQKVWPDAEVHNFPDCGHYILEDAFDEIEPIVETFFETHPARASAKTSDSPVARA